MLEHARQVRIRRLEPPDDSPAADTKERSPAVRALLAELAAEEQAEREQPAAAPTPLQLANSQRITTTKHMSPSAAPSGPKTSKAAVRRELFSGEAAPPALPPAATAAAAEVHTAAVADVARTESGWAVSAASTPQQTLLAIGQELQQLRGSGTVHTDRISTADS